MTDGSPGIEDIMGLFQGTLSTEEALNLSLQLLLWAQSSNALDSDLAINTEISSSQQIVEKLAKSMQHLSQDKRIGDSEHLLLGENSRYFSIPKETLIAAIQTAQSVITKATLSSNHHRSDKPLHSSTFKFISARCLPEIKPNESLPEALTLTISGLLDSQPGEEIGCLYDSYALIARNVAVSGSKAHLETPYFNNLPWLVRELGGFNFSISFVNPLTQGALTSSQKNIKHDKNALFLPEGKLKNPQNIDPTWLKLLPNQNRATRSLSVLAAAYALSKTRHKLVMVVSSSFLSARGNEHDLRKEWVNNNLVETVIALPTGILAGSNRQISIIILNKKKTTQTIRFINATTQEFVSKNKQNQTELTEWKHLLALANSNQTNENVSDISIERVINTDFQLTVRRYVHSTKEKQAYNQLSQASSHYNQLKLSDCVEFIRQSSVLNKLDGKTSDAEEVMEVTMSDFRSVGYLKRPHKKITVNKQHIHNQTVKTSFLQPHDIIISIRGTTGKVTITSPHIPSPSSSGWLVNKSCLILRAKAEINPIDLYMYLQSEVGQTLLGQIVSGSTTPLIQLNSLKNLPVVIPPTTDQTARNLFARQVQLQEEIDFLKQEQLRLGKRYFPLTNETGD